MTKLKIVLGTMLVATLDGSVGAQQTVIHGCVRKLTGVLRVVSQTGSCLPGETPLVWAVEGPAGPTGPPGLPGAQGPQGDPGLPGGGVNVVDAVGTVVGAWQSVSGSSVAMFKLGGVWVRLRLTSTTEWARDSVVRAYYLESDCSGQAYLFENPRAPFVRNLVGGALGFGGYPDGVFFYGTDPVLPEGTRTQGYREFQIGNGLWHECIALEQGSSGVGLYPMAEFNLLSAFVLPFRLQ